MGRFALVALCVLVAGCGGNKGAAPTAPTPMPAPITRVISVAGDLSFGEVAMGAQRERAFGITNSGTGTLTVSSLSISSALMPHITASWTSGAISVGATQSVILQFTPSVPGLYSGTITVNSDQTSGSSTLPISASAAESSAGVWQGSAIVEQCDGTTGSAGDLVCSTQRGVFPPGTSLPIAMELSQSGNSVSGTLLFGPFTVPVTGVITPDGNLTLQGSAPAGTVIAQIVSWNTRVSGNAMSGTVTYHLTLSTATGTAVIVVRLAGVARL